MYTIKFGVSYVSVVGGLTNFKYCAAKFTLEEVRSRFPLHPGYEVLLWEKA
jgi:hypothetical protein